MGDSERGGMFKSCTWLVWLFPLVMLAVGFFGALLGPRFLPQKQPAPIRWNEDAGTHME
jgi:hypothetical protein